MASEECCTFGPKEMLFMWDSFIVFAPRQNAIVSRISRVSKAGLEPPALGEGTALYGF